MRPYRARNRLVALSAAERDRDGSERRGAQGKAQIASLADIQRKAYK
jgi:hypothetical protein